jgi:3-oxoacyl-ACP reductase-like protein
MEAQHNQPRAATRRLAAAASALVLRRLPPAGRPIGAGARHPSRRPVPTPAAATGIDRFDLTGKVALITAGAGDLFGSSVTEALAEAGATVLTASRSLDRNRAFCEGLQQRGFSAQVCAS